MNACLKPLPCRLDSVESLIPYLRPTSRGVVSDDSRLLKFSLNVAQIHFSGFMHVHLHPQSQKMCGLHLGEEKFYFSSLPFGIPTGILKIFV